MFAPKIVSIEEFIEELSGLKIITPDELLIKSYQAYLATESIVHKETFEEYASWANSLLNDFNEIDRYLINPKAFFDYLSSIKTLEKWGVANEQTQLIKNYLEFWNNLHPFYDQLNSLLAKEQLGYQGKVYRKAAEDIEHYIAHKASQKHIFIGFNALNASEQQIIQELLEAGQTEIYWDIDTYLYEDEQHSASLFIRSYLNNWKYYQNHPLPSVADNFRKEKNISIVEAPNNLAQTNYLGALLSSFSEEKLQNTAVVLADETLLIPVLYSLPENVQQVNVTMGLSLGSFDATVFFESLLRAHFKEEIHYYFKTVFAILSHPLSNKLLKNPQDIVTKISSQNRSFLSLESLETLAGPENREVLQWLFGKWDLRGELALLNCQRLLQKLRNSEEGTAVELLVWRKLDEILERISKLTVTYPYLNTVSAVSKLFSEMAPGLTLDFEGDAYNGLQVMGVLETRGLDFENVILLSANEGILPGGKSNTSFITYDLKKQFGLPLFTEKDAVYTYHFYRLLHRAKQVELVYNSYSQGLSSGEISRYLLQLEINNLPDHSLQVKTVTLPVSLLKTAQKQVEKTTGIMEKLKEIAGSYFSPSALARYIRNPIDFYHQRILNINEAEEVEETVAYNTLGTIVHNALENLYKPFEGELLQVDRLRELPHKVAAEVSTQFLDCFKAGDFTKGKNLIIFEVAKRYVENLIRFDIREVEAGNTIKIVQLEAELKTKISIPELDYPLFLGGKVDRIDLYNDQLRIIDYKTGRVLQKEVEVVNWDELILDYKHHKAFQVLAYALMIQQELGYSQLEAGVISFKNLSGGFLKFAKKAKPGRSQKETIISEEILADFLLQLKKLILEICNPAVPFIQKQIDK